MKHPYSTSILQLMRQAIAEAGGNEVFFLGHPDADQCIVDIDVLARGNAQAVPAILSHCRYGDVVIHNHPSGNLQPSPADIEIASRLGAMGVGFHIVDNPVDNLYVVVESFRPKNPCRLDPAELSALLGPGGVIAAKLPGYEDRPEQLRMAFAVAEAFNQDQLAVVEAGTGTGKSLAYLIPALIWAKQNEERVVVSTNTINLQEQLIRKDLPFLERTTGIEFRAVLVKGRGNYLCRRRLAAATLEPELFDLEATTELDSLQQWADHSHEGSREELPFIPRAEIWDEVCCEADQCARVRCQHYQNCFFHRARRQAAQADLLVVNHALLLSDLALRLQTDNYTAAAVLPPFDRVIIDEAHHLEDVATQFFATSVTRFAYARVLNRLRHPRQPDKGLLPRLLALLARELTEHQDDLYRDLHGRIEELLIERQQLFERMLRDLEECGLELADATHQSVRPDEEIRQRILPGLTATEGWDRLRLRLKDLAGDTTRLARHLEGLTKTADRLPEPLQDKALSLFTDLAGIVNRLAGIAGDLHQFIADEEQTCAWFELKEGRIGRGSGLITRLCTAPVEVAESLKRALFDRFRTVVMTSATLSVEQRFDYFRQRVGLERCDPSRRRELRLPSPFDFASQALLVVPKDVPEPGQPGYAEAVRDLAEQGILAADGRSFVLFTAYSMLRRVHGELAPVLQARGYRCLRQGEGSRHQLLKDFSRDATSVLFATDSFWEGVDVPGDALQQVILARLPFKVPTEPVLEARAEAIARTGGDPFSAYTVPQAVLKFKQGFGRLIRHRSDRGVVLILDARVIRKSYGRRFLRSLPEVPMLTPEAGQVPRIIREFFARARPGT